MAQLVTRVDDRLLAAVDALVDEGVAATRSASAWKDSWNGTAASRWAGP